MELVAFNNSPSSRSCFRRTITLLDWWLTKPESNADTNTIGVAGFSHQGRAKRCFSSAPILKVFNFFELETVDGVCIILQGYINKDQTLGNGFSTEIFDHFIFGFPHNWREFTTSCPERDLASECVTRVQKDVKDSIEGHGYFHCNTQKCDSDTVDIGVQVICDPSVEISQEHITEAGSEVLHERSPVTPGFEVDPNVEMSPIVSNTADSPTGSKCFMVCSRRMTRSMKKMDDSKHGFSLVNDISNLDKGTLNDSGVLKNLRKSKLRRKQFDQNVDIVTPKDRKGISSEETNKDCDDLTDKIFSTRTNMKGCRNKKRNRVNVPQKEDEINCKGGFMTRSKSKSKKLVKRKLITSPKSAKSTSSTSNKGSEELYESANILSLESFSGKKSRSGRIVLPPLEFWRNQKVVYDEDRQMCGVQEPK